MFGFVYTYFFTTLHQIGFVYFLHKMCISWKMHLAQGLNTLWMWCAIKINRESNSKMICNSISVINFIPVVGNPVTKKNQFYNVCLKYTMLQKLSKCEVKAWLYRNLIILPPLRFNVKSNFEEFKRSENVNFSNWRGSKFWF